MEIANQTNMKAAKKRKNLTPESQFRYALDTCSKNGDLSGALALYEGAIKDTIHLSPYHFNTLLHVVSASVESLEGSSKQAAVEAGFRIFDHMVAAGAMPTEATVTSMARIAAQRSDGGGVEFAFELVRTMRERYGTSPRLRTYGPALFGFCRFGDAGRAYAVEDHMNSIGVTVEEPEIAALFEVSAKVGRGEKVYEYLQKLRRTVRCVPPLTAEILEEWFRSEQVADVGCSNWDMGHAKDLILMNGGGWHGLGWLGKGRWEVRRAKICSEGCCSGCGQQLACVDIDVVETEKFAESVASLAMEREVKSNFKNFQEWLENHGEHEAIVDAANVAYYQQNFSEGGFSLSQLDTVVKELRESSASKWPLIILHNRRVHALIENPSNMELIETWRENNALYTTPHGSNDDWYWLYAAVKLKSLLVTNDEMRDHIFELLGRDFFSKWKERHQVRYTFAKGNPRLMMPPPYSSVIQESETGSWHVPLDEKSNDERLRTWICATRPSSSIISGESTTAARPTQTSADLQETPLATNGIGNGVQLSSSFNSSFGRTIPVNGKRKDRSPSPS